MTAAVSTRPQKYRADIDGLRAVAENATVVDERPCIGKKLLLQQGFFESVIDRQNTIRFAILDGLNRNPDGAYVAHLRTRIDFLEARKIGVIIFVPHMRLGHHPKSCFSTPLRSAAKDCSFDRAVRKEIDRKFLPVIQEISRTNPTVRFFDQNELFCSEEKCSMVSEGMPLARDYGHISEYGSIKLQGIFSKWAEMNIPEIFNTPPSQPGARAAQSLFLN